MDIDHPFRIGNATRAVQWRFAKIVIRRIWIGAQLKQCPNVNNIYSTIIRIRSIFKPCTSKLVRGLTYIKAIAAIAKEKTCNKKGI